MSDKNRMITSLSVLAQAAVMLAVPVLIFLFAGLWLDDYFDLSPVFTITGIILGFLGSILNIYRVIKHLDK